MNSPLALIDRFKHEYADFGAELIGALPDLYLDNVKFIDPVHHLEGLDEVVRYYNVSISGLNYCRFEFIQTIVGDGDAAFTWLMRYSHKKIKKGEPIEVNGSSFIRFDDKIYYHRDYYDLAEMMFDHLPLLGGLSRFVKRKIGGQ